MKYAKAVALVLVLLPLGCNQAAPKAASVTEEKAVSSADDKEQIQTLIRQTLNWANSKNSIDLLPALTDNKDSIYIGFDLSKHKQNLTKLRQTRFFGAEFIENYNQIILTLDKKLRSNEFGPCLVGESPPFRFVSGADPWCDCQDTPYDKPNPWNLITVTITNMDKGEANWTWGELQLNSDPDWKNFSYKFKFGKENGSWRITYMQGFDFQKCIEKNY